jgi:hypothetical protein
MSNRFAALKNADDNVDMNRIWKSIRKLLSNSLGYYKLEQNKPWFNEVLKISRTKEAGKIARTAESKSNVGE